MSNFNVASTVTTSVQQMGPHGWNCEQLIEHARVAGSLLGQLRASNLERRFPATKEALEGLEEALKRAVELVERCSDKNFLYLLATGWSVVYQFRELHDDIDRYIALLPLVPLVHEFRMQNVKKGLEAVEKDKREYTLDEEDIEAQKVVLKPDRTKKDAEILEKYLCSRYPNMEFHEALQEEKQRLNIELQIWQANNDPDQCRLIEHLIGLTESVISVFPGKKVVKLLRNEPIYVVSGSITNGDFGMKIEDEVHSQWHADLFGCCREPCLCLKTFIYPCGTFSKIATAVSEGKISPEKAINDVIAYSVLGGCCCYTCCYRKKLRQLFNIEGGSCDDFTAHLMCCCCAMVQEQRELELRNFNGFQGRKMIAPPFQYMKT